MKRTSMKRSFFIIFCISILHLNNTAHSASGIGITADKCFELFDKLVDPLIDTTKVASVGSEYRKKVQQHLAADAKKYCMVRAVKLLEATNKDPQKINHVKIVNIKDLVNYFPKRCQLACEIELKKLPSGQQRGYD